MAANQKVVPWRSQGGRRVVPSQSDTSSGEARIEAILHPKHQSHRLESVDFSSSKPDLSPPQGCSPRREVEPTKLVTILVADDHPVVREGLVTLIERQPDMHVVAEASNGREALERFFDQCPNVALLDLRMPIMDGIDTVMSICEKDPAARISIVTSYQNEEDIYRALRAGALGFIVKDATPDELAGCIRAVARGETWIPAKVGAMLAKRVTDRELTRREAEVLRLVAAGKSNKEIGVAFDISEATVKVHMTHLLEKLKVTGRTEAINVAVKKGLVRLDMSTAA
jgi:two-component system NarL family response regulator